MLVNLKNNNQTGTWMSNAPSWQKAKFKREEQQKNDMNSSVDSFESQPQSELYTNCCAQESTRLTLQQEIEMWI